METQINDYEIWDLKNSISHFILPRLKLFIEKVENGEFIALPTWANDNPNVNLNDIELKLLWVGILKEMAFPFEYNVNPHKFVHLENEDIKKFNQKGLELFSKYFQHLWD